MIGIVQRIPLFPWKCLVCGEKGDEETNREYFVDTGISTYDEGSVYICNTCFTTMVVATPDHVTREQMNEALDAQNEFISSCIAIDKKWKQFDADCLELGIDLGVLVGVINERRNNPVPNESEPTADGTSESAESTDSSTEQVDDIHIGRISL